MVKVLYRLHILSRSVDKHGRQTILVSDWPISNNLLLWNCLAKLAELWWEAEPLFSVGKARTFVVLQLVTNVDIAAYVWKIYDFKIEVVPLIINFSTELTTVVKFEVKVQKWCGRSCIGSFFNFQLWRIYWKCINIKKSKMSKIIVFVNVWRKNIFDIYVTEYGTALTNTLPILFLYLNTVTVTTGLYTFSLYENASLIIFSAETEYISTRYWYRNINFLRDRIRRIFL
jgi:hypothetical protein